MASAESVDLLCAFIKWYGLRIVESAIRDLIARGARFGSSPPPTSVPLISER
ncbi:hypothetical protein NKG94_28365 [Micromonospora sp. M12]